METNAREERKVDFGRGTVPILSFYHRNLHNFDDRYNHVVSTLFAQRMAGKDRPTGR